MTHPHRSYMPVTRPFVSFDSLCVLLPSSGRITVSWPNIGAAPYFSCYIELKLFFILRVQLCSEFVQFFLIRRVQFCSESAQLCSESAQLRQRVLPFLHTYFLKSPSRQWVLSLCILREEFRYCVICTLFKNVLCILY